MASEILDRFDDLPFKAIVEGLPMGITVVDLKGTLLYFNPCAAEILDRKPAYLGTDIRRCHRDPASNTKIDRLLEEFAAGRRSSFSYRAHRYGRVLDVIFTPLLSKGQVAGVIQAAVEVKPDVASTPSQ